MTPGTAIFEDDAFISAVHAEDLDAAGRQAGWVTIDETRLDRPQLATARLPQAQFHDVEIAGGDLANLAMERSGLTRVRIAQSRLTGVDLPEAQLEDVQFSGCAADMVSFRFASLRRVAFTDCSLRDADFSNAKLAHVSFAGCDLRGAQMSAVQLTKVDLRGANLESIGGLADLKGAVIDPQQVIGIADQLAAAIGLVVAWPEETDR